MITACVKSGFLGLCVCVCVCVCACACILTCNQSEKSPVFL